MSPTTHGRADWLWALVGLGFGVLGLVFAMMFRERPATAAQPGSPAPIAGDAAILQLVEEVRLLRETIEKRPVPAEAPRRMPLSAEGEVDTAELLNTWFSELDGRLALLASTAQGPGAGGVAGPVELPGSDFQPLPFPAREEVSTQEFSKRHIFWGYQQVVDAYGVPDQISTNPHGSQIWVYDDGDADLEFVFRDGFVLRVEW